MPGCWPPTPLPIMAPIVGPRVETFLRLMLALCIYEALGLLQPGAAKQAEAGSEKAVEKVTTTSY